MIAAGSPTFCWHCNRQLQRAPGVGKGLFHFAVVKDRDNNIHRVHLDCLKPVTADGDVKEVKEL